jgi:hypothetical protein
MTRRHPEPRLITVIKRLADLEARGFLKPSEMSELNRLRVALAEDWPEVSAAVVRAYLEQS